MTGNFIQSPKTGDRPRGPAHIPGKAGQTLCGRRIQHAVRRTVVTQTEVCPECRAVDRGRSR